MYLINFIKVQEAIWEAMNTITKYPVLDYVEFDSINPPIIRLGNLYFDDNSVKNNEGIKAQQYINIYSTFTYIFYTLPLIKSFPNSLKPLLSPMPDRRTIESMSAFIDWYHIQICISSIKYLIYFL